jgi:hypothetical protein
VIVARRHKPVSHGAAILEATYLLAAAGYAADCGTVPQGCCAIGLRDTGVAFSHRHIRVAEQVLQGKQVDLVAQVGDGERTPEPLRIDVRHTRPLPDVPLSGASSRRSTLRVIGRGSFAGPTVKTRASGLASLSLGVSSFQSAFDVHIPK